MTHRNARSVRGRSTCVNHSWCMCVVGHGYGGFGGCTNGGGEWYACGKKLGNVTCLEMPEHIPSAR